MRGKHQNNVSRIGRRGLFVNGLALGAALTAPRLAPAQVTAPAVVTSDRDRPQTPHGVMSGDAMSDRAVVWSRTDRPARMLVEWSTSDTFANAVQVRGPHALEPGDFTARVDLQGLPPGQDVFYRVSFLDLGDLRTASAPVIGRFRTAPATRRDLTVLWGGDTAGQGYGINLEWGGMKIYETMRRSNPDLFIHSGDTIYADGPIVAERQIPGGVWKNVTTEEKSKVAETLAEFRGNYKYNLLDANVRRFNAEVAQIWQWDDHEVTNNWSGSKSLTADSRYTEKRVPLLIARGARAFLEYAPMRYSPDESERVYRHVPFGPSLDVFVIDQRSYRAPNSHNRQDRSGPDTVYLGRPQMQWLKEGLLRSRATWKIIASDMPIGLLVGDGRDAEGRPMFEAIANGDGPALGREMEIAELLRAIKHNNVRNVVWLTADTHYTAAHFYDPTKAQFTDFDPFWEFMSGPLNAGTFGPNQLDNTFGIQVVWHKAPPQGQVNLPPSMGMQFFGEVKIDARSEAMTVHLRDLTGASLWQTTLEPRRD
jgi:alkaline phosphatase D